MASVSYDPRLSVQAAHQNNTTNNNNDNGAVVEEISGLIKVYRDGHVDRPLLLPNVPSSLCLHNGVTTKDVLIDKFTNVWARVYAPSRSSPMPLLLYFHGGGFCVGSAAWSCYHHFLSALCSSAGCVVLSVNYRLAPENRLPAAYEDGIGALMWVKQQALCMPHDHTWWLTRCNFSSLFLAGDSAGANIAFNVATRLSISMSTSTMIGPLCLQGNILIQPFFGGEIRTASDKYAAQPPNSALTLAASDTFWRLSLPLGANRDHPWCNPLARGSAYSKLAGATMVCVSEMDILRDRDLKFCSALAAAGKVVETKIYKGVGHAFQVLHNSHLSQFRTQEMMFHIKAFITSQ